MLDVVCGYLRECEIMDLWRKSHCIELEHEFCRLFHNSSPTHSFPCDPLLYIAVQWPTYHPRTHQISDGNREHNHSQIGNAQHGPTNWHGQTFRFDQHKCWSWHVQLHFDTVLWPSDVSHHFYLAVLFREKLFFLQCFHFQWAEWMRMTFQSWSNGKWTQRSICRWNLNLVTKRVPQKWKCLWFDERIE